ncbi:TPA: hypothetical protein N2902_001284 [Vibrio parahaemolyticus]|uniref:Polysaccharide biosynthesis protein n=1 Tax=Vibrio parahaemolyticus TaxID=670 RepID=A0A7M1VL60_VIBPH|nr:hypothetical protein [Vibrio parahaemolyticus]EGQ9513935.1 hypothetical protein [Vibrio parahaemolyticus]EJC7014961.1 hypothetical protein [Vibrio parahaemolyticus]EJU8975652.1 hypothetical protein [Vibrio parahaemolyticus]EJY4424368.1 hypothetical protein [Vibrio parahaemolyticus]ELC2346974.1 hypothetical protein [Vibrio parahaemolyticus]
MSFKNSAFWAITSNLIISIINIVGLKVLSGYLDSNSYGQELYLYSNAIIIGSIFGLGVGKVINEVQSTNDEYRDEIYKSVVKYSLVISCTLLTLCFVFIKSISLSLNVSEYQFAISTLICVLYVFDNFSRSFLIGRKVIKKISVSFLLFTVIGWLSSLFMFLFSVDYFYLKGMLLIFIFSVIYNNILIFRFDIDKKKYEKILFYKVVVNKLVPSIVSQLLGSLPQILISTYLIIFYDAKSVAVYVIAMYIFRAMLFIPAGIQRVMLPYLGGVNGGEQVLFVQKNILINTLISLPFLFVVFIFNDYISSLFSFDEYTSGHIFFYTVLAGFLSSLSAPIGQIIITMNRYYFSLLINFVWAFIYILMAYFFAKKQYHVEYIMLGLTISYVIHATISILYLKRLKNEISN